MAVKSTTKKETAPKKTVLSSAMVNNRIETNPKKMLGKPVIKGTRITVELLLRQLAQGLTVQEILKNYPHLKTEDIFAAIEYANLAVFQNGILAASR